MLKNLLRKEILLAMHPTAPIFLGLSAMLLIPSYPYYVVFFYTTLSVFFTCMNGRENHDVFYTLTLPVQKRQVVQSRMLFVLLLELLQVALAVPFAVLRSFLPGPNEAGMDANTALFGFALMLLGLFNFLFFTQYYKRIDRVGSAFVSACGGIFLFICVLETCVHVVPFFRDCLDTPDPQFLGAKLLVLAAGLAAFGLLTWAAYRRSASSFETLDF